MSRKARPKTAPAAKPPAAAAKKTPPLRFAHPFHDRGASTHQPARAQAAGGRMSMYVTQFLHEVPAARHTDPVPLGGLIGDAAVAELSAAGNVMFHLVGDTGVGDDSPQTMVADAMTQDYDTLHPEKCPALMLHLGDVIYGPHKYPLYREQFYSPYKHYPGKIIAIPGNHDGDSYAGSDPVPLKEWLANFCDTQARVPTVAAEILRETTTLPGAYWFLDSPFAQIIGLYSNKLENPGHISGTKVGPQQRQALVKWLRASDPAKALIIAAHHPFYSAGGHSGSTEMLADVDAACQEAGRWPDLCLAAHSHSYQRYVRRNVGGGRDIPYVVLGCSGKGDKAVAGYEHDAGHNVDYLAHYQGYGYGRLSTQPGQLVLEFISVDHDRTNVDDRFTVDLQTHRVSEH